MVEVYNDRKRNSKKFERRWKKRLGNVFNKKGIKERVITYTDLTLEAMMKAKNVCNNTRSQKGDDKEELQFSDDDDYDDDDDDDCAPSMRQYLI